jgi:KEOPS complex subunit Cgi121
MMDLNQDTERSNGNFEIRTVSFNVEDLEKFLSWLREVSQRNGVNIVCFNADLIAGYGHVFSALAHAERALKNGSLISSSFEIEALLYASGSRQCQEAVKFGVHQGLNNCYLCIYPENSMAWSELSKEIPISSENWEIITAEKKNRLISVFGITKEEIEVTGEDRLKDLILERVALLEVYK